MEEPSFKEYYQKNLLKKCPKCKFPCIKESGCNQVQCPSCKLFFCYRCAAVFFKTSQECYDHLNKIHGGYYDNNNPPQAQAQAQPQAEPQQPPQQ